MMMNITILTCSPNTSSKKKYPVTTKCNRHDTSKMRIVTPNSLWKPNRESKWTNHVEKSSIKLQLVKIRMNNEHLSKFPCKFIIIEFLFVVGYALPGIWENITSIRKKGNTGRKEGKVNLRWNIDHCLAKFLVNFSKLIDNIVWRSSQIQWIIFRFGIDPWHRQNPPMEIDKVIKNNNNWIHFI